jgi:hypothetical protein
MEGYGSVPRTNGSGRPKTLRIRNAAWVYKTYLGKAGMLDAYADKCRPAGGEVLGHELLQLGGGVRSNSVICRVQRVSKTGP